MRNTATEQYKIQTMDSDRNLIDPWIDYSQGSKVVMFRDRSSAQGMIDILKESERIKNSWEVCE